MIDVHTFRKDGAADGSVPVEQLSDVLEDEAVFVWIDSEDPSGEEIDSLQQALGLHPVAVEDVHHRGQRSKVELYDDRVFVVLRPVTVGEDGILDHECEVHAFAGPGFIATLRFGGGFDMRDVVARWTKHPKGFDGGSGFALYVLVDEVVDGYLDAIETFEDQADEIEDRVFEEEMDEGPELQAHIFQLKRSVIRMRRLVVPLRQGVDLVMEDERLTPPDLVPYYRDVSDHVIRCMELADNVRDILTSLLELRASQIANRTNLITKRISAWAGIILVPTLIAGIYGMNFRHMPELHWVLGYPLALGMMVVSGSVLFRNFRKRDWL